jgi:hypothetical protein
MTKNTITPQQAAALIEAETGEVLPTRRLIRMARHGTHKMPALKTDEPPRFFRFDRDEILEWARNTFPADSKHTKRDPDARHARVARNGRRRAD